MRAGWLSILGEAPVMPRDVCLPLPGGKKLKRYQQQVSTTQEYFRLVEEHAPRGDAWVAWSPANQYDLPGMDRVFGDIDSPDLQDSLKRARRYEEWCMSDFAVQPACIFTAGKGFHLHMTHDYVEALGNVYSDAFASLIQGSGATPDFGPLKTRKSYPRIPYSMNIKATGIHRRPMYVVPVDLTWDLDEILQASADIQVTSFRVPHSPVLADLLTPEIEKAKQVEARRQRISPNVQAGMYEDLVQAAIAFTEDVGWRLVNETGRIDGRRRVLSSLYIPALMHQTQGNLDIVVAAAEVFVDMSGANWREYKQFVERTAKECVMKDGTLRSPVGLKRFWMESGNLRVDKSRDNQKSRFSNRTGG